MLYVIDGTGDSDDDTYNNDMKGGMCDQLAQRFGGHYFRGPALFGTTTFDIANDVYKKIKSDPGYGKRPLYLAGHSRGGAAVIYLAKLLKRDKYPVEAMFLYDAVDRTTSVGDDLKNVQLISRNVKMVFHARRDPKLTNFFEVPARRAEIDFLVCINENFMKPSLCKEKYALAVKYGRLDDAMHYRMRSSNGYYRGVGGLSIDFGNCGIGLEGSCSVEESKATYTEKLFRGSHGAIGGSFIGGQDGAWKTEADRINFKMLKDIDTAAVKQVRGWMEVAFVKSKLTTNGEAVCYAR